MRIVITFLFAVLAFAKGTAQEVTTTSTDTIYDFVLQMPVFGTCSDLLGEDERNACSNNQLMLYILRQLPLMENVDVDDISFGEVIVRFVIDESGAVQNVRLIKGINSSFDKAYKEIFKSMPQWQAGEKDEKPVKVEMTLPMKVHF